MSATLRVCDLCAGYGDTQVLWNVDLEVGAGEIVALVGSNGAGKSTLLRAMSGLIPSSRGSVALGDVDLTRRKPDVVLKAGIAHVPEGRRLFGSLSVAENLLMGAYLRRDDAIAADLERILAMFPRLRERYTFLAGRLSGGEQQMVAIARALMARPQVLLIDEMSLGLAPVLVDQLLGSLKAINAEGVSILMVEQDVQTALECSTRAYVLETGHLSAARASSALLDDPEIKRAYLGV